MLRMILISLAALVVIVVAVAGFRGQRSSRPPLEIFDDMHQQARYQPQGQSRFFADGRAMRPPPAGAVAWGRGTAAPEARFLERDEDFYGLTELPMGIDRALLMRGQQQFSIYCAVCHGGTGIGDGITTDYGMINPPSFNSERVRAMPPGEIFQVITEGRGLMGPYGEKVRREDRWAIIAYMQALQRAHAATIDEVPERFRPELE